MNKVSRLLSDWIRGEEAALDKLTPLVHQELRQLARDHLRDEAPGHTLQSTMVIHEAYLRLVDQKLPEEAGRAPFFSVAARLMRQILVDYARVYLMNRRGDSALREPTEKSWTITPNGDARSLLLLDRALKKLASFDKRKCHIIEMRSFGRMSIAEMACALRISETTVERDVRLARAWLKRELEQTT